MEDLAWTCTTCGKPYPIKDMYALENGRGVKCVHCSRLDLFARVQAPLVGDDRSPVANGDA